MASIIMRQLPLINKGGKDFGKMQKLYDQMGMKDDLLSHSWGRIFEYPWALLMLGQPDKNMRILDAGCGASPLPVYLRQELGIQDVTGIDSQSSFDNPTFSFKPEWTDKFGVDYVRANIIDYRSKVFDRVFCISVLEHIYRPVDRLKAIMNLWENVRDGGRLIMTFDYMQWVGIGLQYLLMGAARCIDCVDYDGKITAICLEKINHEGMSEWVQMNDGK